MDFLEKPISYYLEVIRDNPTTELDAPTIAMLLQAFRAYILENAKKRYIHKLYIDESNGDFYFVIINNSEDEIESLESLIENNDNIVSSYGVLYGANDNFIYDIKLNGSKTNYNYTFMNINLSVETDLMGTITSIKDTVKEI